MEPLNRNDDRNVLAPDERRLSAVLHADVAGYSRLIGLDDIGTIRRLRTLRRELIDPAIQAFRGRIVNTAGDSMLIAFDSIDGALQCALRVQRRMQVSEGDLPIERRIRFRVGINLADVISDGTDIHGDGVNIAARLQTVCPIGGVCISRVIRDHVHGPIGQDFKPLGRLRLKNIAQPVEAFALSFDSDPGPGSPVGRRRQRVLAVALLGGLLLTGMVGGWLVQGRSRPVAEVPNPPARSMSAALQTHEPLRAPRLSLVVLPFDNLGGDRIAEYVVDGFTEDLTTDLSRIQGLLVISRQSAFAYKGKQTDIKRIGEELNVRYALEGSLRKVGDVYRVNVQLISTETGTQIWAERFDIEAPGLGAGQNDIAQRLAIAMGMEVVSVEAARSARERPTHPDAFDLILQARALLAQPTSMGRNAAAQALYEQALQLDPSSATAMGGLAITLLSQRFDRGYWLDGTEQARVTTLVAQARSIAPTSDDSLAAAILLFELQGRYQDAMATAQRLIDANPNGPRGYIYLARSKIYTGQAAEAIPLLARAIQLNPRDPAQFDRYWRMALAHVSVGRYREAVGWAERALAAFPDAPARNRAAWYDIMAAAYALDGNTADAKRAANESYRLWPYYTVRLFAPEDPTSETRVVQVRQFQEGLRRAGLRDHAEEGADFGVPSDGGLHGDLTGYTPTAAPGVRTIQSADLAAFLVSHRPVVVDCMCNPFGLSWGRSVPGAIGLRDSGVGGNFSDGTQDRLRSKMQELTKRDFTKPIVVVGWNSENFGGRNLALRLAALGYAQIYWYRGGREAWEVAGMPSTELEVQDW